MVANVVGVTGDALAQGALDDPQFKPPAFPRIVDGTLVHVVREGQDSLTESLMVRGLRGTKVFRGSSVKLLQRMIELLNGSRSHAELAFALEVDLDVVEQCLYLLLHAGVLIEGSRHSFAVQQYSPTMAQALGFENQTDILCEATRYHPSTSGLLRELKSLEVAVLLPDGIDKATRRVYEESAGRLLKCVREVAIDEAQFVVAFDPWRSQSVIRELYANDVKVLGITVSSSGVTMGPVLQRGIGGCPDCIVGWHLDEIQSRTHFNADRYSQPVFELSTYVIDVVLLGWLGSVGERSVLRNMLHVDFGRGETELERSVPFSCGALCKCADGELLDGQIVVRRYEDTTQFLPESLRSPRDHQRHYEGKTGQLVQRSYEYATMGSRDEDSVELLQIGNSPLGEVLRAGVGVTMTSFGPRRLAPNGGNLGSVQVCVSTYSWPGVANGHYNYIPADGILSPIEDAEIVRSANLWGCGYAEIHLTTALQRISAKYGATSLKICSVDAGAAIANMEIAADVNNIETQVLLRSDASDYSAVASKHRNAEMLTACIRLWASGGSYG